MKLRKLGIKCLAMLLVFSSITTLFSSCSRASSMFYREEKEEPTCTSIGFVKQIDIKTGDSYMTDVVPSLGHSYSEWEISEPATCEEEGTRVRKCERCGKEDTQKIPPIGHNYVGCFDNSTLIDENGLVLEETYNDENMINSTYKCANCGKPYEEETNNDYIQDELRLFDCDPEITFIVTTSNNEDYIRENIVFMYDQFFGTDMETKDEVKIDYTISAQEENKYEIKSNEVFEAFTLYRLSLSGDVSFCEYNSRTLIFNIDSPEIENIELSDNVIFLKDLEEESPGYFPYSYVYDEASAHEIVHLGKKGVFDETFLGKTICIGGYSSESDISMLGKAENVIFGNIEEIIQGENESIYLVLSEPSLSDIYSTLEINKQEQLDFSDIVITGDLNSQIVNNFLRSNEYAQYIAGLKVTTLNYCAENGLDTNKIENLSFMDNAKISTSHQIIDLPNGEGQAIQITVDGNIPIELKKKSGEKYGSLSFGFSAKILLEYVTKGKAGTGKTISFLGLKWDSVIDKFRYIEFTVEQKTTFTFDYNISLQVDYDFTHEDYIVNNKSGIIHQRGCRLAPVDDYTEKTYESIQQMYNQNAKDCECKLCRPISRAEDHLYVINVTNNMVHLGNCISAKELNSGKKKIVQSLPVGKEYTYCENCKPDINPSTDFENKVLEALEYSDWSTTLNQVKAYLNDKSADTKRVDVANISLCCLGIFELSIDIDFSFLVDINASLDMHYSTSQTCKYGFYSNDFKVTPIFEKNNESQKESTVKFVGTLEVRAGMVLGIRVGFIGLSDYAYVGFVLEGGVYSIINGAASWVNSTSLSNDAQNYAAAYAELGLYYNIGIEYKLGNKSDRYNFFDDPRIPILKAGSSEVYCGYEKYDENISFGGEDWVSLDSILPKISTLNLVNMKKGTTSICWVSNSIYDVDYSFKNEDGTPCSNFGVDIYKSEKKMLGVAPVFAARLVAVEGSPDECSAVMIVKISAKNKKNSSIATFLSDGFSEVTPEIFVPDIRINIHYNRNQKKTGDFELPEYLGNVDKYGEMNLETNKITKTEINYDKLVTDAERRKYSIPGFGGEIRTYEYPVPMINLDSPEIARLNEEIRQEYGPAKILDNLVEDEAPWRTQDYSWYVNGDILSLMISQTEPMDDDYTTWKVYNVSISGKKPIGMKDVIAACGISYSEYNEKCRDALTSTFADWFYDFEYFTNRDTFLGELARTTSDSNIEEAQPFINENGELCIVGNLKFEEFRYQFDDRSTIINLITYTPCPYTFDDASDDVAADNELVQKSAQVTVDSLFSQIAGKYEFSSGAGAWETAFQLSETGAFQGRYCDYDGEDVYNCEFDGKISDVERISDTVFSVQMTELNEYKNEGGFDVIENGLLYHYLPGRAYGLVDGEQFLIYLPGTLVPSLSRESYRDLEPGEEFVVPDGMYIIYNVNTDSVFYKRN